MGTILATLVDADGKLLSQGLLLDGAETRTRFLVKLRFSLPVAHLGRLILFKVDGRGTAVMQIELPLTLVP